jgi:serine/threonine protein kinase
VATEELQKMIDSFLDVSVQSLNSSNLKEAFFEMEIKLAEMDEEYCVGNRISTVQVRHHKYPSWELVHQIFEIDEVLNFGEEIHAYIQSERKGTSEYLNQQLEEFEQLDNYWHDSMDRIGDLKNEIGRFRRRNMQKEVQDVETQLQEVLVSVKKLAKERECKYFVLATELYNLFPEIKVLRPQLKIDNFLETDGLEKETRSIDNYEELVELKVDAGVRHKLFKGKWDGHECVLKQFQFTNAQDIRAFRREIQALIRLKHTNMAEIECFFLDEMNQLGYIQLPFYDGGNLSEWRDKHKPPNFQIRFIIGEILKGIEFIHAAGFIHCDLKPQNILMTQEGS